MRRWLLLALLGVCSLFVVTREEEVTLEDRKRAVVVIGNKGRIYNPMNRRWWHFRGIGTGFFVSPNGYIVTAAHVVEPPEGRVKDYKLTVEMWGVPGLMIDPHIVYENRTFDVAVLKIDLNPGKKVPYFRLADGAEVGDKVFALGHPKFLKWSYIRSMVSNKLFVDIRKGNLWVYQLEDSIPEGISGGPVFNEKGEVVCMAHMAFTGGIASTGFCVPSTDITNMLDFLGVK